MKRDAVFVQTDVSKAADVEAMVDKAIKSYGRLDCAVNSAGVPGSILVSTVDHLEEEWDKTIDINLKGVWLCLKYQIPQMLKQGGGTIVNLASVAGLVGSTIGVAYIASKHGVVGITKAAAYEYASKNIRINAICPGTVRTPMGDLTYIGREELMKVRHPIGRVGTPADIAEAALWLCSDATSFITGTAIPVDGGFMSY
jgi:NAD(P)-dependent dehydrogenase (short-subunit alcohol dehydrogenase family)